MLKKISKKEEYEQAFKSFHNFILTFYNIMMNMTATVIRFMPYAVVCMMANVLLSNGFEAIKTAGLFYNAYLYSYVNNVRGAFFTSCFTRAKPYKICKKSISCMVICI
ncbi:cation:dicarboxylase symporter family transporter [Campylobacter jejuni]|nr:cation:dicarboxylase symporter family transporter [Campylobacter jejuni]